MIYPKEAQFILCHYQVFY